jgi:Glycosyltransferase family 87/WD40-like Beta Propeller Repeat
LRTSDFSQMPEEASESRFLQFFEYVLLMALLALFIWHALIPAWQTLNSDFPNYYLAASLYRRGVPLDRVYEWTWFQRQNDLFGVRDGIVGFAPNPPICALPIAPLTALSPLAAKRVWLILSLFFITLAVWALQKVTTLGWRRVLLIVLLCIVPLHSNFLLGQFYALVLLLISVAYYASRTKQPFACGFLVAIAAMLKLFPALFLLFFLWKRNWRAVGGFICGASILAIISVATLGREVHLVFLSEVLPQVSRGDWLAPYELSRNSFITLWSHLFLFEPELNASPFVNSPTLYVVALAATTTALLVGFLLSASDRDGKAGSPLEWAAMVPLLLLLSSTTGSYHSTVLIFAAIVGFDVLVVRVRKRVAIAFLLLFVTACAPVPIVISRFFPLTRLVATLALYAVLLGANVRWNIRIPRRLVLTSIGVFLFLAFLTGRSVRNRAEDLSRRLPSAWAGLRAASAVPVAGQVAIIDMQQKRYSAVTIQGKNISNIPLDGDALSLAGTNESIFLYVEIAGSHSLIVKHSILSGATTPDQALAGHDPSLSADGEWLALLRANDGQSEVWIMPTNPGQLPQLVLPSSFRPLEMTVSSAGDVIAAVGSASHPRLILVKHAATQAEEMAGTGEPTRYPAISPNGKRLAFSRRELGSWHLVVRDLASGREQQLTHTSCNATSPAWQSTDTLLYATDCGRGVGLSAIAQVVIP